MALLFWLSSLSCLLVDASNENVRTGSSLSSFSVPGTTQTLRGYDTEMGREAICWRSFGVTDEDRDTPPIFQNSLLADFYLNGTVNLLRECPRGNQLTASAPVPVHEYSDDSDDNDDDDEPLRTGRFYNYTVTAQLNLTSLSSGGGTSSGEPNDNNNIQFLSDQFGAAVAVQVVVCELGTTGFCSPFIHEESNARLVAQGKNKTVAQGDRHGGSHVHSKFQIVEIEETPIFNFTITVPMIVNDPGDFFAIALVQIFIGNGEDEVRMRYDMANALEERLVFYKDPPVILVVSDGVRIFSYVAIAIVASIITFLLFQTILHRRHQVLRLTQGSFLIVFLLAALVATISAFTLNPVNSMYCRVSLPLVMTSIQIMYAVTVGRLWRINAVISPLLVKTMRQQEGCMPRIVRCFRRVSSFGDQPKTLRTTVTNRQLAMVVAFFSIPQFVIQMLGTFLQPQFLDVELNDDLSKGSVVCSCGIPHGNTFVTWGYVAFVLLVVFLLCMAQATHGLPSLFNETSVIFNSTLASLVLLVLGAGIQAVTNSPTTTPAVKYLVEVVLVLSMTLQTTYRIMMPKLRMIWNGEVVVVSKLVSDHRATTARDNDLYQRKKGGARFSTVFKPSVRGSGTQRHGDAAATATETFKMPSSTSGNSNSLEVQDEMQHYEGSVATAGHQNRRPLRKFYSSGTDGSTGSEFADVSDSESPDVLAVQTPAAQRPLSSRILVKQDETPARRLVLKMVDLQEYLTSINGRIMSGRAVSESEWERLRSMSNHLSTAFHREVAFEWELEQTDVGAEREPLTSLREEEDDVEDAGCYSQVDL